ncbi:hypothetical protein ACIBAC_00080 [Streptomyces sp. NPDC051362]|uniref:hypothetical protein n=1 Tax=Streptomyces sp. NPDC051362 TaxID=3365651 RepID=UPI00378BF587
MTTAVAAPPRGAVAFDLEGALIDVQGIQHLAGDASAFHLASLTCPPNAEVVEAAQRAHAQGLTVLVMTGGSKRLERHVVAWLNANDVPATLVVMRGRGDFRPTAVVKGERLLAAARQFANLTVWSADPSVTRVSERNGIDVCPLPGYWGEVA